MYDGERVRLDGPRHAFLRYLRDTPRDRDSRIVCFRLAVASFIMEQLDLVKVAVMVHSMGGHVGFAVGL